MIISWIHRNLAVRPFEVFFENVAAAAELVYETDEAIYSW